MSIALVASATITAGGANNNTSSSFNSTGANLIIVCASFANGAGTSISDSAGNTWTSIGSHNNVFTGSNVQAWYCLAPTTNASHTVTLSSGSGYPGFQVLCFSGVKTSSPLDNNAFGDSGGVNVGTFSFPAYLGTLTPSADGSVIIAFAAYNVDSTDMTIDASFTLVNDLPQNSVSGGNFSCFSAYLVQGTATPFTAHPVLTVNDASTGHFAGGFFNFLSGSTTTPINQTFSDGLTFSDSFTLWLQLDETFSETLTLSDSVQLEQEAQLTVTPSESWGFSDSLNLNLVGFLNLSLSDNFSFSDLLSPFKFQFFLHPTDTLNFFDIPNLVLIDVGLPLVFIGEFFNFIDRAPMFTMGGKFAFSDTLTFGDSEIVILKTTATSVSETVSFTDTATLQLSSAIPLVISETLAFMDTANVLPSTSFSSYLRRYLNDVN